MGKLLASSSTMDGIKKMILEFSMGSWFELVKNGENQWSIHNRLGKREGIRIIKKKSRYRFELT